jgi:hypothetical protein
MSHLSSAGAGRHVGNPNLPRTDSRRMHADKIVEFESERYNTAVTLSETSKRVNGDIEWPTLFWRKFVSINIMTA